MRNPFIYSRSQGTVLFAHHGEGIWEPTDMFENLAEMATCFAILGDIYAHRQDMYLSDSHGVLPKYRDEARRQIVDFTGSPSRAEVLISSLGWESLDRTAASDSHCWVYAMSNIKPQNPELLTDADVNYEPFHCCGDEDLVFIKCPTCQHLMVFCYECDTLYPDLNDPAICAGVALTRETDRLVCPQC